MFLEAIEPADALGIVADTLGSIGWVGQVEEILQTPKDQLISQGAILIATFLGRILLALIVYYFGRWAIKKIKRFLTKILNRRHVNPSLVNFLVSMVNVIMVVILVGIIISTLGFNTTSYVALFASAGVAIGLALSGTLQNFAGGIMLLIFKPFRPGDYIEAQGQGGTVKSVNLTTTTISTPDNRTVMLPNGAVFTGVIVNNRSVEDTRRVEWTFGIGYGDDYDKAKSIIASFIKDDPRVLAEPDYFIAITSLGDNSVNIVVRVWVKSADYWGVYFDMNEKVYKGFAEAGLNIPFPQLDVHLHQGADDEPERLQKR